MQNKTKINKKKINKQTLGEQSHLRICSLGVIGPAQLGLNHKPEKARTNFIGRRITTLWCDRFCPEFLGHFWPCVRKDQKNNIRNPGQRLRLLYICFRYSPFEVTPIGTTLFKLIGLYLNRLMRKRELSLLSFFLYVLTSVEDIRRGWGWGAGADIVKR